MLSYILVSPIHTPIHTHTHTHLCILISLQCNVAFDPTQSARGKRGKRQQAVLYFRLIMDLQNTRLNCHCLPLCLSSTLFLSFSHSLPFRNLIDLCLQNVRVGFRGSSFDYYKLHWRPSLVNGLNVSVCVSGCLSMCVFPCIYVCLYLRDSANKLGMTENTKLKI